MANKNNIKMVRGETRVFHVVITGEEGTPRELASGEKLVFGVVRDTNDAEYLIKKIMTSAVYDSENGRYILQLDPTDTEELSVGKYWYDVWLVNGGEKIPVIGYSNFELTKNAVSAGRGL